MSQRNPLNERYQPNTEREGKTKKSASSAKPKRKASEGVHMQRTTKTKEEKRKEQSAKRKEDRARINASGGPQDPEYKKWRKVWWATMILTAVCTFLYMVLAGKEGIAGRLAAPILIAAYVLLIAAIFIEFKFCRPIRKRFEQSIANMTVAQKRKYDAKIAAEREAERAAKAAKKAKRRGNKAKADEVAEMIEQENDEESEK
jgi:hypothetical protein